LPTFAPIFDSAWGGLWNADDDRIEILLKTYNQKGKKLHKYIEESSPIISIEENTNGNQFELVDFVIRFNDD